MRKERRLALIKSGKYAKALSDRVLHNRTYQEKKKMKQGEYNILKNKQVNLSRDSIGNIIYE